MGIEAKGWSVGPAMTRPWCAGSICAPWNGQIIDIDVESYWTVQPACVQTASYATTELRESRITRTGSPVLGSTAATEPSAARSEPLAKRVPTWAVALVDAGDDGAGVGVAE